MKHLLQKDSRKGYLLIGALLVLAKLLLGSTQMVYITPQMAPLDDTLMYEAAVSITRGEWLGAYNWLTLSKYMLFPVWLAFVHTLRVPYLLAGHLLYAGACLAGVAAFAPVLRRRATRLLLLAFLLFCPAQVAGAVALRVYRDNLTMALAMLLFAGFAGAALRWREAPKKSLGFLAAAGVGLAGSFLNREDGAWYLAFCLAATAVTCAFILTAKGMPKKALRCAVQAIPYAVLGAGVAAFCTMNYAVYGRFILSDFTSREFKDAYGAMLRVTPEQELAKIPVTKQVRQLLYEHVPELAAIAPVLESADAYNGYADPETGEYGAGGFYWALRQAVYKSGFADTAAEAQQYYETVAQKINALCDSGVLPCGKRISSTMMPWKNSYFAPAMGETVANFGRLLSFAECSATYPKICITPPELRTEYEAFLGNTSSASAAPNTDTPYYNPAQRLANGVFRVLQAAYTLVLPLLFLAALVWQAAGAAQLVRALRKKQAWDGLLLWVMQLGLLLTVLLRCGMVGYLFVTAFNPWVGRLMYLCGVYPALQLFAFAGAVQCAKWVRARRGARHDENIHTR